MFFKEVCCVVILYNPDEATWNNINSYAASFAKILVFDNSDKVEIQLQNQVAVAKISNGNYLGLQCNIGISTALNQTFKISIDSGFNYVITMDQDSSFSEAALFEYGKAFLDFKADTNAAILGMAYNENITSAKFVKNHPVGSLITSGSICSLEKYLLIGGFDERFFIDWVDEEYCCNARSKGFVVLEAVGVHLNHTIGNKVHKKHLLTNKIIGRDVHSPLRFYYMLRNFLLIKKKFAKIKPVVFDSKIAFAAIINRFKNVLIYGDGFVVFYYIYRALVDFRTGKFGKFKK